MAMIYVYQERGEKKLQKYIYIHKQSSYKIQLNTHLKLHTRAGEVDE